MYCPNCKQEFEGKFCPECGTRLLEKSSGATGIDIKLGDANAISGGIHTTDSHNVHNEDRSVHNITNTTVTNLTQVSAQKTETEVAQERKAVYLNACKRAYEDNVLEQSEVIELEELRIKLSLDKNTANAILESVRVMSERNARKTALNPIARTKLKILTKNLQKNEVKALIDQIDSLEPLVRKFEYDELSRKYFLVLAALKSEKCIEQYETSMIDSYWKSFWNYLAYIKLGQLTKAENVLISLDRFTDYPEDNMSVLAVAGSLIMGNVIEAKEYLNELTGEYTPALQRFVDSIYLLLEPEAAKEMGADENTCAFYLVNFFGQKDPKAKAEEERLRIEAEKQAEATVPKHSGTTCGYVDNAQSLRELVNFINNNWDGKAREACILENGMGVILRGAEPREAASAFWTGLVDDIYGSEPEAQLACEEFLGHVARNCIKHISFNTIGSWCYIYDDPESGKWNWGGVNVHPGLEERLEEAKSEGKEILSISISENDDWALVTDKSYSAYSGFFRMNDIMKAITKAGKFYGDQKSVYITNLGVVVCCAKGVYYEDIPRNVAKKIGECIEAGWIPTHVSFTDSGTFFISNNERERCTWYM